VNCGNRLKTNAAIVRSSSRKSYLSGVTATGGLSSAAPIGYLRARYGRSVTLRHFLLLVMPLARPSASMAARASFVRRRGGKCRLWLARCAERADGVKLCAQPVLLDLQVIAGLQVQPEPFGGAEVPG
jgi:hypothetical protein